MKFKIKQFLKAATDDRYTIEEVTANNLPELTTMMDVMGYRVEVLEQEGTPNSIDAVQQAVKADQDRIAQTSPTLQPPTKEFKFSDNGVEYKIMGGVVFKKDWVTLDTIKGEYRLKEKKSGCKIEDAIVEVKDWVEVKK